MIPAKETPGGCSFGRQSCTADVSRPFIDNASMAFVDGTAVVKKEGETIQCEHVDTHLPIWVTDWFVDNR